MLRRLKNPQVHAQPHILGLAEILGHVDGFQMRFRASMLSHFSRITTEFSWGWAWAAKPLGAIDHRPVLDAPLFRPHLVNQLSIQRQQIVAAAGRNLDCS